jgi:hypothetical protein
MAVQGSTYLSESAVALGGILEFDWLVTHYINQFSLFLSLYHYFIYVFHHKYFANEFINTCSSKEGLCGEICSCFWFGVKESVESVGMDECGGYHPDWSKQEDMIPFIISLVYTRTCAYGINPC